MTNKSRYALLAAVLIVALGLMFWSFRSQSISDDELQSLGVVVLPEAIQLGELNLVDENGSPFSSEQLKGKWSFGFFGYTHCPDICPITLGQMKTVYDELKEQQDLETLSNTQRIFVSVDVQRDDHERVKSYTDTIDSDIIGITGDPNSIREFAESVYVGYKKMGDPEADKDYLVEHQGNILIFDRSGNCYGFIKSPFKEHHLARIFKGLARLG